jgi:sugar phosphate isomerase/epimerase
MTTRRKFIKSAGLIAPAVLLMPNLVWADKSSHPIGLQLYTLRDLVSKDPKGVLEKVAAAGYKEIELYGYGKGQFFGMPVKEFSSFVSSLGMKSPSGHYAPAKFLAGPSDEGTAELNDQIAAALEMKHEYLTIPWLNAELRTNLDDYKKLSARINAAGEICKKAGLQLAYHNHDFEFKSFDGTTGYDIMTKETDPNLVKWELDLYWVVFAGMDPIALFEKLKGRVPLWHVKDMDKVDRTQNTEIGNGTIDYKRIFKAAKVAGVKHYFVEQENNYKPDPIGSINASYKYFSSTLV